MTSVGTTVPESVSESWAVGTAVLAVGADDAGGGSLAVWHVSPAGRPTGAWIERYADVLADQDLARRFLVLIERRALLSESADLGDIVTALTAAAGTEAIPGWWADHVVTPASFLDGVIERRELVERVVGEARTAGRAVAPVAWNTDLATIPRPATTASLRAAAGLADPAAAPVAAEAIAVTRVLRWLVTAWDETEQVKNRRTYVADALGAVEPLPPVWRTALLAASAHRLPL